MSLLKSVSETPVASDTGCMSDFPEEFVRIMTNSILAYSRVIELWFQGIIGIESDEEAELT